MSYSDHEYCQILQDIAKVYFSSEEFASGNQNQRAEEVGMFIDIFKMVKAMVNKHIETEKLCELVAEFRRNKQLS